MNLRRPADPLEIVSNRDGHYVAYGDTRETAVWTRVYVPLLFHPVPR